MSQKIKAKAERMLLAYEQMKLLLPFSPGGQQDFLGDVAEVLGEYVADQERLDKIGIEALRIATTQAGAEAMRIMAREIIQLASKGGADGSAKQG